MVSKMPQTTPAAVRRVLGLLIQPPRRPVRKRRAPRERFGRMPSTPRRTLSTRDPGSIIGTSIRGRSDRGSDARRRRRRLFRFGREVLARIDKPVHLELVLLVVELPVPAVQGQQLRVGAALHDL